MNLLNEALPSIQGLIKNQKITIKTLKIENVRGFSYVSADEVETIAQIQPLTPFDIEKITQGTLDSKSFFNFWIFGNLAKVLNSLNYTDCELVWGKRVFSVFSKDDWSQNGWVKVIATEKNSLVEPEPPQDEPSESEGDEVEGEPSDTESENQESEGGVNV